MCNFLDKREFTLGVFARIKQIMGEITYNRLVIRHFNFPVLDHLLQPFPCQEFLVQTATKNINSKNYYKSFGFLIWKILEYHESTRKQKTIWNKGAGVKRQRNKTSLRNYFSKQDVNRFSFISFLISYSQMRPSVTTWLSFWHLFDKSLISLMASGLKRANQIFRIEQAWTGGEKLSNFNVGSRRDFARTLTKAYWR